MTDDILKDLGVIALSSRLKRLAERMQGDAANVMRALGYPTHPSQFPLLAAIDRYGPLTVNQAVKMLGVSQPAVTRILNSLVKLELLATQFDETDKRQKIITLTDEGKKTVAAMKRDLWRQVGGGAKSLLEDMEPDFLDQISKIEAKLDETSLEERALSGNYLVDAPTPNVTIRPYSDDLAEDFYKISAQWIEEMFTLEAKDIEQLKSPRQSIIDKGGEIFFADVEGHGIVGVCALQQYENGEYELTKMGVLPSARGLKIGEALLKAIVHACQTKNAEKLFLLTNKKNKAAINLYWKFGFKDDNGVMSQYGKMYARCDVAMIYPSAKLKNARIT